MGYIRSDLLRGEDVVHEAALHWFMFVTPVVWLLAGLTAAVAGRVVPPQPGDGLSLLGLAVAGLALVGLLARCLVYVSTEFVVTNKRVIAKTGLLSRTSLDVLLPKVDAVLLDQTILGRVFGFGTVVVSANTIKEGFAWIAAPRVVRQQVQECQSDLTA